MRQNLSPIDAEKIIDNLRRGVPPLEYIEEMTVGQEKWIDSIRQDIDQWIKGGNPKVRIISGGYGEGKSHLLTVVSKIALDRGYAVSYVKSSDTKLTKFESIYSSIIQNLQTTEFSNCALKHALDAWFENTYQESLKESPDKPVAAMAEKLAQLHQNLADSLSGNFRSAVRHYMKNHIKKPGGWEEMNDTIIRWAQGEKIDRTALRQFDIFSQLEKNTYREAFASLVALLRALGYSGLVVLVDEVEDICQQAKRTRNAAYLNIRELWDSAMGNELNANAPKGCYFLFSATPVMFEDSPTSSGFRELIPLWDRIHTLEYCSGDWANFRSGIINLTRTPLEEEDYGQLAAKISAIHHTAYEWDSADFLSDEVVSEYIKHVMDRYSSADIKPPRILIRTFIELLDRKKDVPSYEPDSDVAGITREIYESLVEDRKTGRWEE